MKQEKKKDFLAYISIQKYPDNKFYFLISFIYSHKHLWYVTKLKTNSFCPVLFELADDYTFIRLKPQYYIVHLSKNYRIWKIQLKQMRYVSNAIRKAHWLTC
jgi:hypothetical protein